MYMFNRCILSRIYRDKYILFCDTTEEYIELLGVLTEYNGQQTGIADVG